MSNIKCVVSCPVDTYSGYGARSRDFVRALIEARPDWDVSILSQRWGNTRFGYLKNHQEYELSSRIIPKLTGKPHVWIQITVPNEFQPVGEFNLGITAGIETTAAPHQWISGCNVMDLVLLSSTHSLNVFKNTSYDVVDKRDNSRIIVKAQTDMDVLFEGLDDEIYFKDSDNTKFDLSNVDEDFCFLFVGHWLTGEIGHDRKNVGYTIKAFLETFKNKQNPPALLLKTNQVGTSIIDRNQILEKINAIRSTVKGALPNIYLIHGEMSDEDMNNLYNNPKVKAMISLTKGEGFGRPLLEFSSTGKPIIASSWSGHMDFLHPAHTTLIEGTLEKVHPSAAVKDVLLPESSWFRPDDGKVGSIMKHMFKKYKTYLTPARKQRRHVLDNFTFDHMADRLDALLSKHTPKFAIEKEVELPQLNLPKLTKK